MQPEISTIKINSQKPSVFYQIVSKIPPRWYLVVALASGTLMGLAPAPVNAWFLAWVALAPLWVLVVNQAYSRSRDEELKKTARYTPIAYAFAWGIGYHGLALSWITELHPMTWMGMPWLVSLVVALSCWAFVTLWGAGIVVLWAWLFQLICLKAGQGAPSKGQRARDRQEASERLSAANQPSLFLFPVWLRILMGTALWCALETLWSYSPLYWSSLSYTQSPHDLVILHLGQISGPQTVTAAIVAFNGLLAEAWIAGNLYGKPVKMRKLLSFNLAFLIGLHLIGFWLYSQPLVQPPDNGLKVGIVQGNIPTRIKLFEQGLQLSLDNYIKGYETLADQQVDAVLTPEGALPWLWIGRPAQNPLYQAILRRKVPAWVGTVGLNQGRITQTIFTITGVGKIFSHYDKAKLVPLGEYIPFESVLGGLIGRLSPVEATMIPGKLDQRFDTPFGRAIAGICYESAFAQLFRNQAAAGGQFILTASNNDPYRSGMMAQHHAQDVMRAVETDRWAARATNTGFSGIVDPHGRTQWLSGFRTYETHAHTIYRRQTQTPYVRWGDWLTPLLLGLAIGSFGVLQGRRRLAMGDRQQG